MEGLKKTDMASNKIKIISNDVSNFEKMEGLK